MDKHPQGVIVIPTDFWSLMHQGSVFLDITKPLHLSEGKCTHNATYPRSYRELWDNEHDTAKAKETIRNELGPSGLEPLYFFLDPKFGFSIDTRILVTEIYTAFPFTILPVAYHSKHEQFIRPALRKNYPEIIVNTDRTLIHITNRGNRPPSFPYKRKWYTCL